MFCEDLWKGEKWQRLYWPLTKNTYSKRIEGFKKSLKNRKKYYCWKAILETFVQGAIIIAKLNPQSPGKHFKRQLKTLIFKFYRPSLISYINAKLPQCNYSVPRETTLGNLTSKKHLWRFDYVSKFLLNKDWNRPLQLPTQRNPQNQA